MSGTRVQLDLFFKDMTPQQVNLKYPELLPAIKKAKAGASKINAGAAQEEMTVRAVYHYPCHHDDNTGLPCGDEQEI